VGVLPDRYVDHNGRSWVTRGLHTCRDTLRYDCPEHGTVRPGPRRITDINAGFFEPRCQTCGQELAPGLIDEKAILDPRSTYAVTKLTQENLARVWARETGGSVWAMRYHNVYGPRMPRDTPYAGVASIFRSALARGEPPNVMEDGAQRRDFIHVADVAKANALALTADAAGGEMVAVNICSGEPHTILELATQLAAATGGPAPNVVGGTRPGDIRHVVADPSRARELLGISASISFANGITEFATASMRAPARITKW
jgi:dTDP-L-rhamnose 4-epimerase